MKGFFKKRGLHFLLIFIFSLSIFIISPYSLNAASTTKRLAGAGRYETAVEISKHGWPNGADYVVLARGDLFADALAGAPFASSKDAPILLTYRDKLQKGTKEEIKRLKPKKIYILGGPEAITKNVENEIKRTLNIKDIERIYGNTRYDTAEKIARKLGMNQKKIILATGEDFPDALSIAPFAGQHQIPILLVQGNKLPYAANKYLKEAKGVQTVYVIGGEKAISPNVIKSIPNTVRISGNTRYDTSLAILSKLYDANETIFVTTGLNFADALTGSVLAAKNNTGILLLDEKIFDSNKIENLIQLNMIKDMVVLGGKKAVPQIVITKLSNLINKSSKYIGTLKAKSSIKLLNDSQSKELINAVNSGKVNDDGSLTITSSIVKQFKNGQIFMVKPGQLVEKGFIGEVRSINKSTNQMTIIQPTLDEVFDKVVVKADGTLSNLLSSTFVPGVKYDKGQLYLENIQGNNLTINGIISLSNLSAKIDNYFSSMKGLEKNDLNLKYTKNADLKLTINSNEGYKTLSKQKLVPDWTQLNNHIESDILSLGSITYKIGDAKLLIDNREVNVPIGINFAISVKVLGEGNGDALLAWKNNINQKIESNWDSEKQILHSTDQREDSEVKLAINGDLDSIFSLNLDVKSTLSIAGITLIGFEDTRIIDGDVNQSGMVNLDLITSHVFVDKGYIDGNISATDKLTTTVNYAGKINQQTIYEKEWLAKYISTYENVGNATGLFKDVKTNSPLSNVKITVYADGTPFKSIYSDSSGKFDLKLPEGVYDFSFEKEGFISERYFNVEIKKNAYNHFPIIQLVPDSSNSGTVTGKISDAVTNEPIEGAELLVRKGLNALTGDIIQRLSSKSDGSFSLNLPGGNYTVQVKKDGYIRYQFVITSVPGKKVANQNGVLMPVKDEGKLGIVLTWQNHPDDLDLHLTGTMPNGKSFHLYWDQREYYVNDTLLTNFETSDVRAGFGPEVIAIHDYANGEFQVKVYNYSYRLHNHSTSLAYSSAKIDLYQGNKLADTFYVPIQPGKIWNVLQIKNGEILPVQTITDHFTLKAQIMRMQGVTNVDPFLKEKTDE